MATSDWSKKSSDAPGALRRQWRADRALRPAMRSPRRTDPSRVLQRQFWRQLATGITSPPPWKGLNKPHRQERRWSTAWSPEQIAQRLKIDFPDDESMRVSHEAIYQSLLIEGRGALKRELVACLRNGRAFASGRRQITQQGPWPRHC